MKKLVKIFCILLIAGFALTFIGVLSGGHAHVAYWDGRLHTLREVLHCPFMRYFLLAEFFRIIL